MRKEIVPPRLDHMWTKKRTRNPPSDGKWRYPDIRQCEGTANGRDHPLTTLPSEIVRQGQRQAYTTRASRPPTWAKYGPKRTMPAG
jgi:hypothetical protein